MELAASENKVIKLNVGGVKYTTTTQTLTRYPNSMLGRLFTEGFTLNLPLMDDEFYFLDANGEMFVYILCFLRTGKLWIPDGLHNLKRLEIEAEFYQIQPLTQGIKELKRNDKKARHVVLLYRIEKNTDRDVVREVYYEEKGAFKPFVGISYDGTMRLSREFLVNSGYKLTDKKTMTANGMHSFLCLHRLPWFPMNQRLDWTQPWGFEWYKIEVS